MQEPDQKNLAWQKKCYFGGSGAKLLAGWGQLMVAQGYWPVTACPVLVEKDTKCKQMIGDKNDMETYPDTNPPIRREIHT